MTEDEFDDACGQYLYSRVYHSQERNNCNKYKRFIQYTVLCLEQLCILNFDRHIGPFSIKRELTF